MVAQSKLEYTICSTTSLRNQRHPCQEDLQRSEYSTSQIAHNQCVKLTPKNGATYTGRYMPKELTWYHIMVLFWNEAKAPENPGANIQTPHEWHYILVRN